MIRTRRIKAVEAAIWSGEADQEITPPAASNSSSRRQSSHDSVQQQEEEKKKEGSDADKSRAVGILFLAHDGITNPDLWERWRLSDPVSRFVVWSLGRRPAVPSPQSRSTSPQY